MRVWRVEGFRQREIWLSLDGESAGDMMLAFNCRACITYFALLCNAEAEYSLYLVSV